MNCLLYAERGWARCLVFVPRRVALDAFDFLGEAVTRFWGRLEGLWGGRSRYIKAF